MSDDPQQRLAREGLLFFGAMGAGLSHEVNNVFNIINGLPAFSKTLSKPTPRAAGPGLLESPISRAGSNRRSSAAKRSTAVSIVFRTASIAPIRRSISESIWPFLVCWPRGKPVGGSRIDGPSSGIAHRAPWRPVSSPAGPVWLCHVRDRVCFIRTTDRALGGGRARLPRGDRDHADPLPDLTSEESRAAALETGCAALTTAPHIMPDPDGGHRIVLSLDAPMKAATTGV